MFDTWKHSVIDPAKSVSTSAKVSGFIFQVCTNFLWIQTVLLLFQLFCLVLINVSLTSFCNLCGSSKSQWPKSWPVSHLWLSTTSVCKQSNMNMDVKDVMVLGLKALLCLKSESGRATEAVLYCVWRTSWGWLVFSRMFFSFASILRSTTNSRLKPASLIRRFSLFTSLLALSVVLCFCLMELIRRTSFREQHLCSLLATKSVSGLKVCFEALNYWGIINEAAPVWTIRLLPFLLAGSQFPDPEGVICLCRSRFVPVSMRFSSLHLFYLSVIFFWLHHVFCLHVFVVSVNFPTYCKTDHFSIVSAPCIWMSSCRALSLHYLVLGFRWFLSFFKNMEFWF